jgi:hypothetical protein
MKTITDQALKDRLEGALAKAIAASGVEKFSKADLVKRFLGHGVSQATLYRWIEASVASGRPGQAMVRAVKKAAAKRAAKSSPARPTARILDDVREHLPAAVRLEDVSGTPTVKIIEELGAVVADLKSIVVHSKTSDGKPRNARLLLQASDRIRACLETAMRIHQALRDDSQIDQLHNAILEEIGRESAEVAQRILVRIDAIAAQWGG